MLTADGIRDVRFTKSMGGYKAVEVDDFIDQCAETVAALTAAKNDLEKKLEVLADKLVEYRNDEDNIRTALLSAQRLGDTVVREAKHKAGLILDDARIKAEKVQETAQQSIQSEEKELERIQREVTNFKTRMLSIYREHLALIDVLPELKEESPSVEAPSAEQTTESLEEVAFQPAEQTAVPQPEESAPKMVLNLPELPEEPSKVQPEGGRGQSPVSRFADLKFGDDYDITQDEDEDERNDGGIFRRRKQ